MAILVSDGINPLRRQWPLESCGIAKLPLVWHHSSGWWKDFGADFLGEDSRVPGAAEHGYTASPLIAEARLIACVGGTNGAGIVCFEKHTGKVLWKSQDDLAAQAVCFTVEG